MRTTRAVPIRARRPRLTMVTVSEEPSPPDLRSLSDRVARWAHLGVELIVVCASRRTSQSILSAISGPVRLIHGPARATREQLERVGVASANGEVVVLVEDPETTEDWWVEQLSLTGVADARG